jgi:hypothetical protein
MQYVDFDENNFTDRFDSAFKHFYEVPKKKSSWFSHKTNEESYIRPYSWFFSEESDSGGYNVNDENFKKEIERYKKWKQEKEVSNGGKKRRTRKKYKKRQTRKKTRRHHSRRKK